MLYSDTWTRHIPDNKLAAYKSLIDSGMIRIRRVVYARKQKVTVVQYDSDETHEKIKGELRREQTKAF